jgi:hypothetical protein
MKKVTNMRSDWKRIIIFTGAICLLVSISCGTWKRWFDYPSLSDIDRSELTRIAIEKILESDSNFFNEVFNDSIISLFSIFLPPFLFTFDLSVVYVTEFLIILNDYLYMIMH